VLLFAFARSVQSPSGLLRKKGKPEGLPLDRDTIAAWSLLLGAEEGSIRQL
jgi:hypothetical protein